MRIMRSGNENEETKIEIQRKTIRFVIKTREENKDDQWRKSQTSLASYGRTFVQTSGKQMEVNMINAMKLDLMLQNNGILCNFCPCIRSGTPFLIA